MSTHQDPWLLVRDGVSPKTRELTWRWLSHGGFLSWLRHPQDLEPLLEATRARPQNWVVSTYGDPGRAAWARWVSVLEVAAGQAAVATGPLAELRVRRRPIATARIHVLGVDDGQAFQAVLALDALPSGTGLVYRAPEMLLVPADADFEQALQDAQRAAGYPGPDVDVRWRVRHPDLHLLRGGSAGLPMALALAGLGGGADLPPGIAATGGVTPDGEVTSVANLGRKLASARRARLHPVLYPACQQDEVPESVGFPCSDVASALARLRVEAERPWQLPARPRPFLGRKAEVRALSGQLREGQVAGVHAPGGFGKTSLAAETLHRMAARGDLHRLFPNGVITCDFYRNGSVDNAILHILASLGEGPRPSPVDAVRRALASKRVLLVLDGAEFADDLGRLLSVRGRAGILITSTDSEQFDELPLHLGPFRREESVELLRGRVGAPLDETLADRLCELVGDLPLAVHLAARALGSGETAADFVRVLERGLEPLHRGEHRRSSITVLLERSLSRATPEARRAFGLLGLLAFAPFPTALLPRGWQALVRLGLLVREAGTVRPSHRLVHLHARNSCAPEHSDARRLSRAFVRRALPTEGAWWIRHASALLQSVEDPGLLGRLVAALDEPLSGLGAWREWAQLQTVQERLADSEEDRLAARGNRAIAWENLGEPERAAAEYQEVLRRAREVRNPWLEGAALRHLGLLRVDGGEAASGLPMLERALRLFRVIGDTASEASTLVSLAHATMDLQQPEEALRHLDAAHQLEGADLSVVLNERTLALLHLGRLAEAEDTGRQALEECRRRGRRPGVAAALAHLGVIFQKKGEAREALRVTQECVELSREMGTLGGEADSLGNLASCHLDLAEPEEAARLARRSVRLHRKAGQAAGEGNDLAILGEALSRLGDPLHGLACCSAAVERLQELGDGRVHEARERLARVCANGEDLPSGQRDRLVQESLQEDPKNAPGLS